MKEIENENCAQCGQEMFKYAPDVVEMDSSILVPYIVKLYACENPKCSHYRILQMPFDIVEEDKNKQTY